MSTFHLPDLGEGLQEAEIVTWHVAAGDRVSAGQPLLSVETEKAVVEVPCPWSGEVGRLCAAVGDVVAVGAPLLEFVATEHEAASGGIVGRLPETPDARTGTAAAPRAPAGAVLAAPAVRAHARARGVALAGLRGSGPAGAITRADVDAAAAAAWEGQPVRGVRRWMSRAMARAHAEVVPASVTEEADISAWPDLDGITPRLVRAVCAGCAASPALNAWFDGRRELRRLHDQVDLGIAVDLADGLLVPVLRDAARLPPADSRRQLADLAARARSRQLTPGELAGATITLSNFGAVAGRHAALVVVPPQVAIVGAGKAGPRARVHGGVPATRTILPLSLTFDHRAVTGGEAARFLAAVVANLEAAA